MNPSSNFPSIVPPESLSQQPSSSKKSNTSTTTTTSNATTPTSSTLSLRQRLSHLLASSPSELVVSAKDSISSSRVAQWRASLWTSDSGTGGATSLWPQRLLPSSSSAIGGVLLLKGKQSTAKRVPTEEERRCAARIAHVMRDKFTVFARDVYEFAENSSKLVNQLLNIKYDILANIKHFLYQPAPQRIDLVGTIDSNHAPDIVLSSSSSSSSQPHTAQQHPQYPGNYHKHVGNHESIDPTNVLRSDLDTNVHGAFTFSLRREEWKNAAVFNQDHVNQGSADENVVNSASDEMHAVSESSDLAHPHHQPSRYAFWKNWTSKDKSNLKIVKEVNANSIRKVKKDHRSGHRLHLENQVALNFDLWQVQHEFTHFISMLNQQWHHKDYPIVLAVEETFPNICDLMGTVFLMEQLQVHGRQFPHTASQSHPSSIQCPIVEYDVRIPVNSKALKEKYPDMAESFDSVANYDVVVRSENDPDRVILLHSFNYKYISYKFCVLDTSLVWFTRNNNEITPLYNSDSIHSTPHCFDWTNPEISGSFAIDTMAALRFSFTSISMPSFHSVVTAFKSVSKQHLLFEAKLVKIDQSTATKIISYFVPLKEIIECVVGSNQFCLSYKKISKQDKSHSCDWFYSSSFRVQIPALPSWIGDAVKELIEEMEDDDDWETSHLDFQIDLMKAAMDDSKFVNRPNVHVNMDPTLTVT